MHIQISMDDSGIINYQLEDADSLKLTHLEKTIIFSNNVFYIVVSKNETDHIPTYKIGIFDVSSSENFCIDYDPLNTVDYVTKLLSQVQFTIKTDMRVFPHTAVDPKTDIRFSDQEWSLHFNSISGLGITGNFYRCTILEILNYANKISKLEVFF